MTYDLVERRYLDQLINEKNPPLAVVNDSLSFNHDINNFYGAPIWLENELNRLDDYVPADGYQTEYCFNFSINKKQINRHLLIKLVEWFGLSSYDYSWSGIGKSFDLSLILTDVGACSSNPGFRDCLLSDIKIPEKFLHITNSSISSVNEANVSKYGSNRAVWEKVLRPIFGISAVSLISESVAWDRAAQFTEKTAFAVMSETFPIWVGGYGMAEEWKRMGFDIFDDIIDHGYQYRDSLLERCYYAFFDNLDLLQDLELVDNLRKNNQARLAKNKVNLRNNLQNYNLSQIDTFPENIATYFQKYRSEFGLDHYHK
jgi:hypothetical protein